MLTLVGLRAGWRRLHRRRLCAAHRRDGRRSRLRGQGAIHPGHLPAQLPVGPRPPTGLGEPGVAGTGLGRWGRTRRLAPDHRPGLDHLRDLWTGQGGSVPPRLHRCTGESAHDNDHPETAQTAWAAGQLRVLGHVRGPRSHRVIVMFVANPDQSHGAWSSLAGVEFVKSGTRNQRSRAHGTRSDTEIRG